MKSCFFCHGAVIGNETACPHCGGNPNGLPPVDTRPAQPHETDGSWNGFKITRVDRTDIFGGIHYNFVTTWGDLRIALNQFDVVYSQLGRVSAYDISSVLIEFLAERIASHFRVPSEYVRGVLELDKLCRKSAYFLGLTRK